MFSQVAYIGTLSFQICLDASRILKEGCLVKDVLLDITTKIFNPYNLDLIPYMQGQALQYLVP
jgi:hypothetical protein